jgi:hypothetical protein
MRLSSGDERGFNEKLQAYYGNGFFIGGKRAGESLAPLWRISWADDLTEKRFGRFRDFSNEGILIREEHGVRETKKYPWITDAYVLEKNVFAPSPELMGSETSPHYELVYVFKNLETGEVLPLNFEIIDLIVKALEEGAEAAARSLAYMTKERWDAVDAEAGEKEAARIEDELNQERTPLMDSLRLREAVTVPEMKDAK